MEYYDLFINDLIRIQFGPYHLNNLKRGEIISIEEKPKSPKSDLAVTGIYLYDSNIFEAVNNILPSKRGELEISDAHQYLIKNDFDITYSEITGWWKDTGQPSDLLDANRLVLDNIQGYNNGSIRNSSVKGEVSIGTNCQIENSNINGPMIIGNNSIIKDSVIGPYSSIGEECKIISSNIEYSIIMDGCNISNISRNIKSSLLGKNVKISSSKDSNQGRYLLGDQSNIEL